MSSLNNFDPDIKIFFLRAKGEGYYLMKFHEQNWNVHVNLININVCFETESKYELSSLDQKLQYDHLKHISWHVRTRNFTLFIPEI